jgi:hypothetical protein
MWFWLLSRFAITAALGTVGYVVVKRALEEYQHERIGVEVTGNPWNNTTPDQTLLQELMAEVKQKLRKIRALPPGEARNAKIRALRSQYHPDRHAHLPMLRDTFSQLSSFINTETDSLC